MAKKKAETEGEQKTVKIASTIGNAVVLQVWEEKPNPDGGAPTKVGKGDSVTVPGTGTPGATIVDGAAISEVDAAWWDEWLDQHKDTVLAGSITRASDSNEKE